MRVVLAALFAFGSMLATVGVISENYPKGQWPWWASLAAPAAMFAAIFVAMFLFNRIGFRPDLSGKSLAEKIADLEIKGLVSKQHFQAVRAFAVEEFEDEGLHYFIELHGGGVLFLSGQYLYEFEPTSDDPELNQTRQFPCTEFEVLRHRDAGYVLDIRRAGTVIEPEIVAPAFTEADWKRGIPEDGAVIRDKSYELLKRERTAV